MREGATASRKEENRLTAVFKIDATARGGAKEARLRASLDSRRPEEVSSGLLTYVGLALERSDRQRFSRGRPFGSYNVGCKPVQSARSVQTAVNVTLNPWRLARIYFLYGRHIRLVRILHPITEINNPPEGLPETLWVSQPAIHKGAAPEPGGSRSETPLCSRAA